MDVCTDINEPSRSTRSDHYGVGIYSAIYGLFPTSSGHPQAVHLQLGPLVGRKYGPHFGNCLHLSCRRFGQGGHSLLGQLATGDVRHVPRLDSFDSVTGAVLLPRGR